MGRVSALHYFALLLDRDLVLGGGRVPVIRDDYLVIVVLGVELHVFLAFSADHMYANAINFIEQVLASGVVGDISLV